MRSILLACLFAVFVTQPSVKAAPATAPDLQGLQLVAQLPPELPQRIMGLAYDGEKLWATIYLGRGHYATLNPSTLEWTISEKEIAHRAISEVAGSFQSPGSVTFINGKLWIGGAYGDSFGSIDMSEWKVENKFKGKQREERASQSYASMAYDGTYLWIAWQKTSCKPLQFENQLLLKVDPATGRVVHEYPLPLGTPNDMIHGLTFDGSVLWHAKDNKLSAIDPSTGAVVAEYTLPQLKRPSGLAWDGKALWISEFDGKIWRMPFIAI